jgi:protocatechuate 3,4-dioxygenase beta subunit
MQVRQTSRVALAALALAVFGLVLGGLVAPATAASSTGKIKGVVSLSGKPVKNAKVQLYRHRNTTKNDDLGFDRVKTVTADKEGRYSFAGVNAAFDKKYGGPSYRYVVLSTDRSGRASKTRRFVTVKKGRTTKLDVRMERAVTVAGAVTRSDGGSPAELTVELSSNETRYDGEPENPDLFIDTKTTVRADGTFTLKGQAAGDYNVLVRGDAYENHCYDFASNTLEACDGRASQDVVLKAGERRVLAPSVVTELAPARSTLTGTVTDPSGRALKGIEISFWNPSATVVSSSVMTRSSGRFSYRGRLPADTYIVRYRDPKGVWGLGAGPVSSVRDVTLTPGQTINGVNARLRSIATSKVAVTSGKGSAKVAFAIKRKATGSAPGGTLSLSYGDVTKTVAVKKGRATVMLTGLRPGNRALVAQYSGTSSTAGFTKTVNVKVK